MALLPPLDWRVAVYAIPKIRRTYLNEYCISATSNKREERREERVREKRGKVPAPKTEEHVKGKEQFCSNCWEA